MMGKIQETEMAVRMLNALNVCESEEEVLDIAEEFHGHVAAQHEMNGTMISLFTDGSILMLEREEPGRVAAFQSFEEANAKICELVVIDTIRQQIGKK